MPYVAIGRIKRALESLPRFHAFFGITFLSMKKSGVSTGDAIVWGSKQEQELIDTYYTPPGAHPKKPFLVPFGRSDKSSGFWKNPKYSGGTLQRARTTDNFRPAFDHPTSDKWAFADNYLNILEEQLPKGDDDTPIKIPVFDLVAWLFRDEELPGELAEVVRRFREVFSLSNDAEFERLFFVDVDGEDASQFYYNEHVDRDELIELLGGIPEGPTLGGRSEEQIVQAIETYVAEEALLTLPEGFVRSFYYAVKTQGFVVLAGRPGTGKTAFVRAFSGALGEIFPGSITEVIVSVGQDYSESDVLGYEKIAGGLAPTELTRLLFLSGRQRDLYVVLLDEMNLAHIDYYFARLLPAIESDAPVELPGSDVRFELPPDTMVVGTANSFLEEGTRVPLSGPVKRRANIMEMPNTLDLLVKTGNKADFKAIVKRLLRQSYQRYKKRQKQALTSVFDNFRLQNLEAAIANDSPILNDSFIDVLMEICTICAGDHQTGLTFGVLQDVVEYVALARWNDPLIALDKQIAQKLVPQLAGPAEIVKKLVAYVGGLRSEEIDFSEAMQALAHLLDSEDPSSGLVFYRY